MNWLVYTLTCVETNIVSIERIAEYIDTESEVSATYLQKKPKYIISITLYVIISQWEFKYPMINVPGLRDILFFHALSRGPHTIYHRLQIYLQLMLGVRCWSLL